MARGRMLSVSIADDIDFNNMSMEAQFLFMRTVPHLDRDGLIVGTPLLLLARVAPLMMDKLNAITPAIIDEWIGVGSVIRYQHEKKDILFFVNFGKNQNGLRYDRESPSSYPPPPGFTRQSNGVFPDDTHEEKPCKTDTPDDCRSIAGNLPDDCHYKGKDKVEGETCAHAHENTRNEKDSPSPASSSPEQQAQPEPVTATAEQPTADEFTWQSTNGEYMPGLPNPKRNRERERNQYRRVTQVNETIAAAGKIGVDAATFRQMVDAYLTRVGKKKLADLENETGEQTLFEAQNTILDLCVLDRMFRTVANVESVFDSWMENSWAWATTPSKKQFLEHASQMASGTVKNEKNPPKTAKGKPVVEAEERVNFSAKALYS